MTPNGSLHFVRYTTIPTNCIAQQAHNRTGLTIVLSVQQSKRYTGRTAFPTAIIDKPLFYVELLPIGLSSTADGRLVLNHSRSAAVTNTFGSHALPQVDSIIVLPLNSEASLMPSNPPDCKAAESCSLVHTQWKAWCTSCSCRLRKGACHGLAGCTGMYSKDALS